MDYSALLSSGWTLALVAFCMAASLVFLVGLAFGDHDRRVRGRIRELSRDPDARAADGSAVAQAVRSALPRMGKPLLPDDAEEQSRLKSRLIHAGFYQPQALLVFLGVKLLFTVAPVTAGVAAAIVGLLPMNFGLFGGACLSMFGMIGTSFWLDGRKAKRQMALRRALPDAVDLTVICMEGGLSLTAALQRVARELRAVHPVLSRELSLVEREVQLGTPMGDALRSFALRCDLAEGRGLAATVKNAERFGASVAGTLRTFGETLRLKRRQYAEEMAQKAGTKVLFPTLIFIFPAIFLIILGPAAIQLVEVMRNMR